MEDDAATRELLGLLLEAEGWTVHAVETGEAAVARLRLHTPAPDVVLCDLHLPAMDGEELAQAMRAELPHGVTLCLIAMSATPAAAVQGYAAGLLKPFPPSAVQGEWERFVAPDEGHTGGLHPPSGATAVTEESPVVDEVTVQQLIRAMGARGAQGLYTFALGDTGDRLHRMERAVEAADGAVYTGEAHAIKGSCGMIGARRLSRLASDAEMEGLNGASCDKVSRMRVETEAVRLMLEVLFPVGPEFQ